MISTAQQRFSARPVQTHLAGFLLTHTELGNAIAACCFSTVDALRKRLDYGGRSADICARQIFAAHVLVELLSEDATGETPTSSGVEA